MRGISINAQIECECGEIVDSYPEVTGIPNLKEFKMVCKCGKKFYGHIQEVKDNGRN